MDDNTKTKLLFAAFAVLAVVGNMVFLAAGIWVAVLVLRAMGVLS